MGASDRSIDHCGVVSRCGIRVPSEMMVFVFFVDGQISGWLIDGWADG